MPKISEPYLQHRQVTASHCNWQNKQSLSVSQQRNLVKLMASRTGLHNENISRYSLAQAIIQLCVMLTSVHNCNAMPVNHDISDIKNLVPINSNDTVLRVKNIRQDNVHLNHSISLYPPDKKNDQPISFHQSIHFPVVGLPIIQRPLQVIWENASEIKNKNFKKQLFKEILKIDISAAGWGSQSRVPSIFIVPRNEVLVRTKRISDVFSRQLEEDKYDQYFDSNCHIRMKTNAGKVVGDSFLVSSEYIRNPARGIAEKMYKSGMGKEDIPNWLIHVTEGINIAYDIVFGFFTFGAYPIIKYGSAKLLESAGHVVNHDMKCLKNAFSPEKMAELLMDTEVGLTNRHAFHDFNVHPKPFELHNVRKFQPDGVFVSEQIGSRLNRVEYMEVTHRGTNYLIREKRPGEYYTFHPNAVKPEMLERRVYFDAVNNKIHFNTEMPPNEGLDYRIVNGKHFIIIYGEPHELNYNWKMKTPEMVLNKDQGKVAIPVYMEPLSKTWHLSVHNGHPVFRSKQKKIIDRIHVEKEKTFFYVPEMNMNPRRYGMGKLYRAEKIGDDSHYAWGRYVEMNGKIVPVKTNVIPRHGVHYEVFDVKRRYPIEWDGRRWQFERSTSRHVSKELKKAITLDMYEKNMDASQLFSLDSYGLQWNAQNNAFLKIRNQYIKLRQLNGNRFLVVATVDTSPMILRFKKNKFYLEKAHEKIQNLFKTAPEPLSQDHPSLLKEQNQLAKKNANVLLSQYRFEEKGIFSAEAFVLQLKQSGNIPDWAGQVRKNTKLNTCVVKVNEIMTGQNKANADHERYLHLGEEIGEGGFGQVFLDAGDPRYVIKKYFRMPALSEQAEYEANAFRHYYGEDSAEVFYSKTGEYYTRMYRVPGLSLKDLPPNSLPKNAVERYVDMIQRLDQAKIIHGDLHPENILWDAESQSFFPIDINNIKSKYHQSNVEEKGGMNKRGEFEWKNNIEEIRAKIKN